MTGDRQSPLDAFHRELGAKMMPFGGWEMPLSYPSGTIAEHMACRTEAAMFDVSHLGTVRLEGGEAFERLQYALTNDLRKVSAGRAQYTHSCNDRGGVVDDIIVWWVSDNVFDVMPNASNTARILSVIGGVDTTASRAVLAVQGPKARERLATFAPQAASVNRFRVEPVEVLGVACIVAGSADPSIEAYLMGGQTDENDFHHAIFTAAKLHDQLESAGFSRIAVVHHAEGKNCSRHFISLNMEAYKDATQPAEG